MAETPVAPTLVPISILDKRTGKIVRSGFWAKDDCNCIAQPYEQRIINLVAPVGSEPFGSAMPGVREHIEMLDQRLKNLEALVAKHGLV